MGFLLTLLRERRLWSSMLQQISTDCFGTKIIGDTQLLLVNAIGQTIQASIGKSIHELINDFWIMKRTTAN